MDLNEYYRYQAKARRIVSTKDVIATMKLNSRLYDTIILPWLPKDQHARIYEVACGPGIFLSWLTSRGYTNISGSDSSDVQIILAKEGGFSVRLTDSILELRALEPQVLDCIVGLDFYEHLPKEIFLDFLFEAARVLRSGGQLILRGPNGDSPVVGRALYNDITHITTYTSIAFTALLEMAGFQNAEFKDETLGSIQRQRWIKVPLAWMAQQIYRLLIHFATRENIKCLSASFFLCSWKK